MNYEKEYNKLVGKIKKAHLYAQTDSTRAVLEDIYPQLSESEDERIRRKMIEHFKAKTKETWCNMPLFTVQNGEQNI